MLLALVVKTVGSLRSPGKANTGFFASLRMTSECKRKSQNNNRSRSLREWPFLARFGGPANPLGPIADTCVFETYPVPLRFYHAI